MSEVQKVPLQVGWLSENAMLKDAAAMLGYILLPGVTPKGCELMTQTGVQRLKWEDHLLFSLTQLERLGFEK